MRSAPPPPSAHADVGVLDDFSRAPVVLTGEALLPEQALALQRAMAAKGQRWSPRADASVLSPPRAFSHAVLLPLSAGRQALGRILLRLAVIFTVVGMLGFAAVQANAAFMAQVPTGAWQQALGLGGVMWVAWAINRRPTPSRRRTIMAYPPHEVADIAGFVSGTSLSLQAMDEVDTITKEAVLPRSDGVAFDAPERNLDPKNDLELHFMSDLLFTLQPSASQPQAAPTSATSTAADLPASQAALVYFASQIEQALGWRAGRVWVLDVPQSAGDGTQDAGVVWATIWLQGGRAIPIDWVCEVITSASVGVLRRYHCQLLPVR